jgi:hypothetical protein
MRKTRKVCEKESTRYQGFIYYYWWDIAPNLRKGLNKYDAIIFTEKDKNRKHFVNTKQLDTLLTESRQTTRGRKGAKKGNWGIKILADDPNTLRIEEPGKNPQQWEPIQSELFVKIS